MKKISAERLDLLRERIPIQNGSDLKGTQWNGQSMPHGSQPQMKRVTRKGNLQPAVLVGNLHTYHYSKT